MTTVTAEAPVRTCDCGGWTDTWFARHGAVFHIAVNPGVRVVVRSSVARPGPPAPVLLRAENYGDRYAFLPGTRPWVRHALLEAAIESVGVPPGMAVEVSVASAVPPGASTGTSAAVCVALVGALQALWGRSADPDAVAGPRMPLRSTAWAGSPACRIRSRPRTAASTTSRSPSTRRPSAGPSRHPTRCAALSGSGCCSCTSAERTARRRFTRR